MIRFSIVADRFPLCPLDLRVEVRPVAAEQAVYRLISSKQNAAERYVEIGYGRERRIALLAGDPRVIEGVFETLVRGEVTPCTMMAVLEDLSVAE